MLKEIAKLREENLKLTAKDLKKAYTKDILVIQTIHTIDIIINTRTRLVNNLRERYGYYAPLTAKISDHEKFLKEFKKLKQEPIGMDLSKKDLQAMLDIYAVIQELKKLEEKQQQYLESLMKDICPNLLKVAGCLIGARLIALAGSLKHLAELPSSTIQILGAEKALFRHLTKGTKAPKHGVIFAHELIQKATNKGKAARNLASAIAKAAKLDYFRKI